MRPVQKQTDAIVSDFTRKLLTLARKHDVPFDYAGHRKTAPAEINRVMNINVKAVRGLLK